MSAAKLTISVIVASCYFDYRSTARCRASAHLARQQQQQRRPRHPWPMSSSPLKAHEVQSRTTWIDEVGTVVAAADASGAESALNVPVVSKASTFPLTVFSSCQRTCRNCPVTSIASMIIGKGALRCVRKHVQKGRFLLTRGRLASAS